MAVWGRGIPTRDMMLPCYAMLCYAMPYYAMPCYYCAVSRYDADMPQHTTGSVMPVRDMMLGVWLHRRRPHIPVIFHSPAWKQRGGILKRVLCHE